MRLRVVLPVSLIVTCAVSFSAVSRIEVTVRSDVPTIARENGPYEFLAGRVYFTVDPHAAPNRIVADIALAPRSQDGQVEFSSDFYLLRPKNGGNGTALVEISNRGGVGLLQEFDFAHHVQRARVDQELGDGFLLEKGYTLVWVGWEFDVPPTAGLLRAYLPIATDHGKAITGLVRSEWSGDRLENTISLGDKNQTAYPVADPADPGTALFVRDKVIAPRTPVPRQAWTFASATTVTLNGGFLPGRIYEVVYLAKDPVVAGLGLAAVRDFVSYLRFGGVKSGLSEGTLPVRRAIAFGVSQSGRLLREFIFDGFNEDERHRQVFDAVWAHVAGAGRGSFNHRFAQPSRDGHPFFNVFYPVDVPPFDEENLLSRARRAHVAPKLFLTNGSYEYWGRCASLIHTTPDGKGDAPPSAYTRVYYFSGSGHGMGSIPPARASAQNLTNTNDYRYGLRALLVSLNTWVREGTDPPPSRYPRLDQGELVDLKTLRFPKIPNVNLPLRKREAYQLDFRHEAVKAGEAFPTLVPQVDADGNELGGVKMPEVAVPLATFTGWNLRSPAIGAPTEMLSYQGSWIPFPRTRAEKGRDPRASIEERYPSEDFYLKQIAAAAVALVRQGFMLERDLELVKERAAKEWNYRQTMQPVTMPKKKART